MEDNQEENIHQRKGSMVFELNELEISKIKIVDPESQYIDIDAPGNDFNFKKIPALDIQKPLVINY